MTRPPILSAAKLTLGSCYGFSPKAEYLFALLALLFVGHVSPDTAHTWLSLHVESSNVLRSHIQHRA